MSNFWNGEGVFEDAVSDVSDYVERRRSEMEQYATTSEEIEQREREAAENYDAESIGIAEYLSYSPSLRNRVASIEDYILLLSVKGEWIDNGSNYSINVGENHRRSAFEEILLQAVMEIYVYRGGAKFDLGYLYFEQEMTKFCEKFYAILKNDGIDTLCKWYSEVNRYIEQRKLGQGNANDILVFEK